MTEKKQEICKNCVHYRHHCILHKDRAAAANCGHCIAVRSRKRKPNDAACGYDEYCDHTADLPDR